MPKTITSTEWGVLVHDSNGKEKLLGTAKPDRKQAEMCAEEHKLYAKRCPVLYTDFVDYKIVKRTVTKIFEDWQEA